MKNLIALLSVFGILTIMIAGCSQQKQEPADETDKETTEQAEMQETEIKAEEPATEETAETPAKTEEKTASDKAPAKVETGPMKGSVVSVGALATGGSGALSTAQAKSLVANGEPIGFLSDGAVYFVYNADKSPAASKLAKYASIKTVGIYGKKSTIKGVKVIFADKIVSMD